MTENRCACGRPSRDAAVCAACAYQLDAAIADVAAYRGLAYDLDIATTRQARLGDRNGSRPTETPLAYDARASEAADHLKGVLVGWARVIADETGAVLPADTLAGIATWLRPRVGWLRHHHAGGEARDEICEAVKQARRVIDRPAERLYAGPCDCGEDLYARQEAPYVTCRNGECAAVWDVAERRAWLLGEVEDLLATTTEISRALASLARPVTPNMIYGYVHRGHLTARSHRVEGRKTIPLYRVGDVLDILARQAERVSA